MAAPIVMAAPNVVTTSVAMAASNLVVESDVLATTNVMTAFSVMAGLDPAIRGSRMPPVIGGTSPAKTWRRA